MSWATPYIEQLKEGKEVSFRPSGNSMSPKIKSGELVTVSPDISDLKKGDIVLCKVKGNQYLHLITGIDGERYQISNNKGRVNGWTRQIYGKLIKVN